VEGVGGIQGSTTVRLRAAGGISITEALDTTNVTLDATGKIVESGSGTITAATLSGTSSGGAGFTGANQIASLTSFANSGAGGLVLDDTTSLTLRGTDGGSGGNVTVATTGAGSNIAVDGTLEGKTVTLQSSGKISEGSSGHVSATKLTGQSDGAITLNAAANAVSQLGAFSTGGNNSFELKDADALTVNGTVNAGTGILDLTTLGTDKNLAIHTAIDGGTVNLVTSGEASETSAGAITASTKLNVTAQKGIVLTSSKNKIKKLGTDKTTSGPNKVTL